MKITVLNQDALTALREIPDASIDAVVTDPPYGLSNTDPAHVVEALTRWANGERDYVPTGRGFMGKSWDAFVPPPAVWDEAFRVLKPGGHLLAFAGSRTFDLMTLSIRFAGFDIRDGIAWLYGSGFPKSLDVSKAIDKAAGVEREVVGSKLDRPGYHLNGHDSGTGAFGSGISSTTSETRLAASQITAPATDDARTWQGWGTALKPAFEPIVVARKPLVGTVAANVLAYGTGALNIDATRVGDSGGGTICTRRDDDGRCLGHLNAGQSTSGETFHGPDTAPGGRWPTNVVLDGDAADELDAQGPHTKDGVAVQRNGGGQSIFGGLAGSDNGIGARPDAGYGGEGGPSRFFPTFRYQAKAPTRERPKVDGVAHPTVKPLDLMRWLVRLVTPSGGVVLDPFAGSGTTLEAAALEGFDSIGVERDETYLPLIQTRAERCKAETIESIASRPTTWLDIVVNDVVKGAKDGLPWVVENINRGNGETVVTLMHVESQRRFADIKVSGEVNLYKEES